MSDSDLVIETRHLSKEFSRAGTYRTLFRLLKGTVTPSRHGAYAALSDINLKIRRGEKIGLIGNNGAGKSSLLRLIAGLYLPSDGQITVNGQVSLLAALGMGMVDDLDIEENIFLYGAICGLDRHVIRANLQEIIEWAELQEFAGAKLRTLSTGMRARLAFSTTRHVSADITLMDEVLTAGDRNFKDKCQLVLENYKNNDGTFIFATHDIEFVKNVCTKTIWLEKGRQKAFGETSSTWPVPPQNSLIACLRSASRPSTASNYSWRAHRRMASEGDFCEVMRHVLRRIVAIAHANTSSSTGIL
jgi:lipopolysaccharide transport system ATP-binding protein